MASLMTIKLNKAAGVSWGFRLQGGKDFATPLCIQKVNVGSVAEQSGLQAGDAIVSINGQDGLALRHKEAQDTIVRAGNVFDIVIQRGTQIWRPSVTALPEKSTLSDGAPVATKTSLVADSKIHKPVGARHNTAPAPFREKLQQQYNSPVQIYSDDSIAETLSAQAEVLDKGVLGVNFMKNDKDYDGQASDVLRMVQEMDGTPVAAPSPTPGTPIPHSPHPVYCEADGRPVAQGHSFKLLQSVLNDGDSETPVRSVASPQNHAAPFATEGVRVVTGCAICERPITGVFVRVKNKNLHAECFKCSTCAASLKNVGYYNINERLYCDVHAKQAARANPPAPGMEPVTVAPGHPTPSGVLTSPQAKHQAPAFVQSGTNVRLPPTNHNFYSAPFKRPVASPVAAPKPLSPAPPKPVAAPLAANPHSFGAPAGDVNVRTHIPKKGDLPGFGAPTMPSMPNFGAPSMPSMPNFGAPSLPSMPSLPPSVALPTVVPQGPPSTAPGGLARGVQSAGQRSAPKRGRGVMNQASGSPRIPMCAICQRQIRGPFVSALGKTWCPDHFVCATSTCKKNIIDLGFVEERGDLYCEFCYESYLAPVCGKCDKRIKGDCLNAVGKKFHPECFCCAYCGKVFGSGAFYLEDGLPYCETDWNDLFTTKCIGCNFPIEAGDRWVEALNNNYHSQCFKCSKCHKNLEGQSFFAKGGKPFCKTHAQRGF